jgi:hypothetical protein
MSWPSVRRVWQGLREEGARTFWFRLLGKLGYRRQYLLEWFLNSAVDKAAIIKNVLFGAADEMDAPMASTLFGYCKVGA